MRFHRGFAVVASGCLAGGLALWTGTPTGSAFQPAGIQQNQAQPKDRDDKQPPKDRDDKNRDRDDRQRSKDQDDKNRDRDDQRPKDQDDKNRDRDDRQRSKDQDDRNRDRDDRQRPKDQDDKNRDRDDRQRAKDQDDRNRDRDDRRDERRDDRRDDRRPGDIRDRDDRRDDRRPGDVRDSERRPAEVREGEAAPARGTRSTRTRRATSVLGSKVSIRGDIAIGTVDDIIFTDDGYVDYLVVRNEGKLRLVPWEAAKFNFDRRTASVNISQERYNEVPTFAPNQWPDVYAPTYRQQIYGYYGLRPGQERRIERREGIPRR